MASASPVPNPAAKASVVPSEVGWQFVPQYYTFVNKQPHRLHCFYTKNSTYVHGVEGEELKPCHGQQEIHNKILSIGFQDCKVFIHSVDAQSSAAGGIIIQVIGEMSNAGEAWRKFAQTFFLAEQPNGYFVLNDIFRYLKEESNADDEAEEEVDAAPNGEAVAPEPVAAPQGHDAVEVAPAQPEPEPVAPAAAPVSQEAPVPEEPVEEPIINGTHAEEGKPSEPAKEATQLPSPSPEPEAQPAEEPTPVELTPPREQTPAPAPPASAPAAAPAPAPAEKPQPPAPSAPATTTTPTPAPAPAAHKTWANLAAANPSGWGQVSANARGVSTSVKPTAPPPKPAAAAPPRKEEPPIDTSNMSAQAQAAMTITTPQCFVKLNDWVRDNGPGTPTANSAESVSPVALREVLAARFGPIKELEVIRSKACAFLEFQSVDSARRAILASLPNNLGGEGGIRIGDDTTTERAPRITVEMRKERGDRPMPGRPPRTGGPEQRGSFRGRGRGRGDGPRGGAPQAAKQ